MTKHTQLRNLAKYTGLPQTTVNKVLTKLPLLIKEILVEDGEFDTLTLAGIGTFSKKYTKPSNKRTPGVTDNEGNSIIYKSKQKMNIKFTKAATLLPKQ